MTPQIDNLLAEVDCVLRNHKGLVALGLDMAANPNNWGLAVMCIDQDFQRAKLPLLLPQAKINKDSSVSPTLLCRPDIELIRNLLQLVRGSEKVAALAVDVPFGWPVQHRRFVEHWSASIGWECSELRPSRNSFERRWCDLALTEKYPQIQTLSVGAETFERDDLMWGN